jgi:hypothetical protein
MNNAKIEKMENQKIVNASAKNLENMIQGKPVVFPVSIQNKKPENVETKTENITENVKNNSIVIGQKTLNVKVNIGPITQKFFDHVFAEKLENWENSKKTALKNNDLDKLEKLEENPPKRENIENACYFQVINALTLTQIAIESKSVQSGVLSLSKSKLTGKNVKNAEFFAEDVENVLKTGLYNSEMVITFHYGITDKAGVYFTTFSNFAHTCKVNGVNPAERKAKSPVFIGTFKIR